MSKKHRYSPAKKQAMQEELLRIWPKGPVGDDTITDQIEKIAQALDMSASTLWSYRIERNIRMPALRAMSRMVGADNEKQLEVIDKMQ